MNTLDLSPKTAAIFALYMIAYCRYAARLPDGTTCTFAISLNDPTVEWARAFTRSIGAQASGLVSILEHSEGDPEPFHWVYRDGRIGFLTKLDAVMEAVCVEMLKAFFADIADVAQDLAQSNVTGYGQPVPVEILARARANLPRDQVHSAPTIH